MLLGLKRVKTYVLTLKLDEVWIKNILSETVCEGNVYDENTVGNIIDRIQFFDRYITICCNEKSQFKVKLVKECRT